MRQLAELVGTATIAREANPCTEAETLGELPGFSGEEEICRQVDEDTSGP